LDFYGRLYPFGGGFFLQAGAGYVNVDGTLKSTYKLPVSVPGVGADFSYDASGSVKTLMLTALIGYFYTTSIGFSIGIDAGAQVPIAPSEVKYDSHLPDSLTPPPGGCPDPIKDPNGALECQAKKQAQVYKTSADDSVRDSLEKIGRTVLPTLNLRIGWIL